MIVGLHKEQENEEKLSSCNETSEEEYNVGQSNGN